MHVLLSDPYPTVGLYENCRQKVSQFEQNWALGFKCCAYLKVFKAVYFGNPKSKLTLNINFEFVQTCYICKVKITAMKASYSESFKALVCQNCYKNATIITFTVRPLIDSKLYESSFYTQLPIRVTQR